MVDQGEDMERRIEASLRRRELGMDVPTTYVGLVNMGRFNARLVAESLGMKKDEKTWAYFMTRSNYAQAFILLRELRKQGWLGDPRVEVAKSMKAIASSLGSAARAARTRVDEKAKAFEELLVGYPHNRADLFRIGRERRCELAEEMGLFKDVIYKRLFTNAYDDSQVTALAIGLCGKRWFDG